MRLKWHARRGQAAGNGVQSWSCTLGGNGMTYASCHVRVSPHDVVVRPKVCGRRLEAMTFKTTCNTAKYVSDVIMDKLPWLHGSTVDLRGPACVVEAI